MKLLYSSILLAIGLLTASCHCGHDVMPPMPFKLGWVVCTDGEILSFCDYVKSDKEGVAIVYNVNEDLESDIAGYAVYLTDIDAAAFADGEEMVSQGTSADITTLDGNENTYALFSNDEISSPIASRVFDMWTYGQSAYIPSVAQFRMIHAVKDFINPRIEAIGGDVLPDDAGQCWYWSSTEVSGQSDDKAWLFSMHSGMIHETPKEQAHKARPVITIYR